MGMPFGGSEEDDVYIEDNPRTMYGIGGCAEYANVSFALPSHVFKKVKENTLSAFMIWFDEGTTAALYGSMYKNIPITLEDMYQECDGGEDCKCLGMYPKVRIYKIVMLRTRNGIIYNTNNQHLKAMELKYYLSDLDMDVQDFQETLKEWNAQDEFGTGLFYIVYFQKIRGLHDWERMKC